jgi:hypothetical protein
MMLARELADYAARRSVHYGWVVAALTVFLHPVLKLRGQYPQCADTSEADEWLDDWRPLRSPRPKNQRA